VHDQIRAPLGPDEFADESTDDGQTPRFPAREDEPIADGTRTGQVCHSVRRMLHHIEMIAIGGMKPATTLQDRKKQTSAV